ncbi:MAG: cysteine-rich CWC family protein [Caldimonas sp.]
MALVAGRRYAASSGRGSPFHSLKPLVRVVQPDKAAHCPLCGNANTCAMLAGAAEPCWCVSVSFGPALLSRIPEESRGRACVCAACAASAPELASSEALGLHRH